MKMPVRACGVLFVEHDDAGGDAGAVKQVRRQADDALDEALRDDVLADLGLGIAAKQDAMRQNDRALAGALERRDNVQKIGIVAVLRGRDAVLEAAVGIVASGSRRRCSSLVGERRIGDDKVEGLEALILVAEMRRWKACCSRMISAAGQSCRTMFIFASARVATSILLAVDRESVRAASSCAFRSSEPEPQVGS